MFKKPEVKFSFLISHSLFLILFVLLSSCHSRRDQEQQLENQKIKTLKRGLPVEPLSIDPHKGLGSWVQNILGDMIIGLYVEDAAGQLVPALAKTTQISADRRKWRFTLRASKWSDGKPVTANDFVFAYQRLMDPKTISPYASMLFGLKNAKKINQGELPLNRLGVRALNKNTLEVELEYPMPYFRNLLSHYATLPVPRHIVSKYGDDWVSEAHIVVNGPYSLKKWQLNNYIHLVKNPKYYKKDQVCFDEIIYQRTQEPANAIRLVKKGILDIGWQGPGDQLDIIEVEMADYLHNYSMLETSYIVFNTRVDLFKDRRVREALSMSINRGYIVEYVIKAAKPVFALVPADIEHYLPKSERPKIKWASLSVKERRKKALTLLRQAGYGPKNPIHFEYLYQNNNDSSLTASIIQNDWNLLADWVNVSMIGVDRQLQIKRLRLGNFEIGEAGWVADYNDPYNFLFLLATTSVPLNYGRYSNKDYDHLLEQANMERNLPKRASILAQAEQLILNASAIIPLWNNFALHLVNPDITGFIDNASNIHRSEYLCHKQRDSD